MGTISMGCTRRRRRNDWTLLYIRSGGAADRGDLPVGHAYHQCDGLVHHRIFRRAALTGPEWPGCYVGIDTARQFFC